MQHYAGLDVSLKEISICVVDTDGKTIVRGTCPADPESVAGWLRTSSLNPHRIVHESGMLSIWLQRGMARLGLPATCIDARKAHKSLSARLNKSDAADADLNVNLAGGPGNDLLVGYRGDDTFRYARGGGADRIDVFGRGTNQVVLSDFCGCRP